MLSEFSELERRNMVKYIAGIMLYKFALETLNGCVSSIMLKRTDPALGPNKMWTLLLSFNYACQCIGSILSAPLVARFNTNIVLSRSIFVFGMIVAIVPLLEGVTGGGRGTGLGNEFIYAPGKWNSMILFAIFPVTGIFYGMVELIRRVIASDIVETDAVKLKKVDSLVHIFYQIAGTAGAGLSTYWIAYLNYGYSLLIIPVMFTMASLVWGTIRLDKDRAPSPPTRVDGLRAMHEIKFLVLAFFHSIQVGAKLVLTRRKLLWLVFAYSLPLALHRYLENVVAPQYAVTGLGAGSFQQKLVAGSNLGELVGASFVFFFSTTVPTPLPWLRLGAVSLILMWVFPLVDPLTRNIRISSWAWSLLPVMFSVSIGWAAGDCSLVAYIQSRLANVEHHDHRTSTLGAVMGFLYALYIFIFAVIAPVMAAVGDHMLEPVTKKFGTNSPIGVRLPRVRQGMIYTTGIFLSACAVIIFAATFLPRGSFAFNPKNIDDDDLLVTDNKLGIETKSKSMARLGIETKSKNVAHGLD